MPVSHALNPRRVARSLVAVLILTLLETAVAPVMLPRIIAPVAHAVTETITPSQTSGKTIVIPPGVFSITLEVVGGSGGRGGADVNAGDTNTVAGRVISTFAVSPGDVIGLYGGGKGGAGGDAATSAGAGTAGADTFPDASAYSINGTYFQGMNFAGAIGGITGSAGNSGGGGGGGAASIVTINSEIVVIAGGGGGAGGTGSGANKVTPWSGTLNPNGTSFTGSAGTNTPLGTCGGTTGNDGGGGGGGGGGYYGGQGGTSARVVDECAGTGGSAGGNYRATRATNVTNDRITRRDSDGYAIYTYTAETVGACAKTTTTVDIYTVDKITYEGNCTWTVPSTVSTIDMFLVGGGGGGGGDGGTGGGGGAALSRTAIVVTPNSALNLKIGGGGAGGSWSQPWGPYAGDSTTVTLPGGTIYSALGGSLGGTAPSSTGGAGGVAGNGGFSGGAGGTSPSCFNVGGAGKSGISNYFTGVQLTFGGGGGGGACPNGAATTPAAGANGGGQGGYAVSASLNAPGANGTANSGGGGGGGVATGTGLKVNGGKGGSGVIFIRYATNSADAFPASVASAIAGRWIPGDLQMLDSARKGWIDSSGTYSGATVVGTPSVITQGTLDAGNSVGSTRSNLVVAGGTSDNVTLVGSNIADYTMFHIARYVTGGAQKRIITASGNNWLSGHYSATTFGAAHHVNNWMTPTSTPASLKFLLSTDNLRYYRANGSDLTYDGNSSNVTGASGPTGLGINVFSTELSNWQFLDMIIFNRELTNGEIRAMENYMARIYGLSLSDEYSASDTDTAVTMDGNQYLRNQSIVASPINDTFTAEAWIKPGTACGAGGGARCALYARENTLMFGVYNGYFYYLLYGTNTAWDWIDSTYKIPINEWHHISLVKRGVANTNNSVELYVDGQLVYTKQGSPYAVATTAATYAATDKVRATLDQWTYVGTRLDTLDRWRGTFDEIKFWKVARSASEIQSDMTTRDLTNPNLQLYFDFNRNVATTMNNVPNLAYGGTNRNDLKAFSNATITYDDVKVTTTAANNPYTIVTFPRSYINHNGGWSVPDSVSAVSLLVVGGGGGGAGAYTGDLYGGGGGGGGGGVFAAATAVNLSNTRRIPVLVGAGGVGGPVSATRDGGAGKTGQTTYFGTLSAGGGGGGGYVTTTNANGLDGTSAGGGGGASNYYNAYNSGIGGTSQPTLFAGDTWQGFDGGAGGIFSATYSAAGDAGPGGGYLSASRTAPGNGISSSITGTATTYGRGGIAKGVTGWVYGDVAANLGTGGSGQYGSSAPGGYGSSGVVIVRWITASKPTFTAPTNAYLNVGMTETFTTNVAQDSATAMLTRTFRWESTTGGSGGTYVAIKSGTGAANASYSWVPSDTATSGNQYLYRVVVTDSDNLGLFIVDTSTPVYAVINGTLRMSGPTSIKKQINLARNETFTISQGTPNYRYTLSPVIAGITLDTSTVGTAILKISDTASVGTYLETLTVTDSVAASVVIPLSITISAPPSLVYLSEPIVNGQIFNIDFGNSNSYNVATGAISDISGTKKPVSIVNGSTYTTDNSGGLSLTSTANQTLLATGFKQMNKWTIDTYIRLDANPTAASCILTSEYAPSNIGFALCLDVGRTVFTGFFNGSWHYKRSTDQLAVGSWSHVLGTFDGTSISLWINGVAITVKDSSVAAGTTPPNPDTDRVFINKEFGTSTVSGSTMTIGYARVYNVGFTYADMLQNYNAAKDRFASANLTQIKPTQKYGATTQESFTITAGGDTETVSFAVGNRTGIKWDTVSTPGQVKLSIQESISAGTYYDTVTVTDNFGQSTYLPIKFTISKADTLTISMDTKTAVVYSGSPITTYPRPVLRGIAGIDTFTVTTKFSSGSYPLSAIVPTNADTYTVIGADPVFTFGALSNYISVVYETSTAVVNKAAQIPLNVSLYGATIGSPFTITLLGGSGDGAVTETLTGTSTAPNCAIANHVLTSTASQISYCQVKVTKAASQNYLLESSTVQIYFMQFLINQPAPVVGSGSTIALTGETAIIRDPFQAPTISSLSTYSAQAGVTQIIISGAGFNHLDLSTITVKFWRNILASGFTVNSADTQITVTVPMGATTGKVTVTTPNGIAVSEFPVTVTP